MSGEGMSDSRRAAILEMAKTYIWRSEVEDYQFGAVLDVLHALGHLDEMMIEHIKDDMDNLFAHAPCPSMGDPAPKMIAPNPKVEIIL